VDPIADETRSRVRTLALEVGLALPDLARPVGESPPDVVARVRLARALALNPRLLLAEHPSASLAREHVKAYAGDIARIAQQRSLSVLVITADDLFARALGGRAVLHDPATGALRAPSLWRKILG
jgi:ABC-type lipoprotein export system ATPase subunit